MHDMDMDTDNATSMGMVMSFTTSTTTPLFSTSWNPSSAGAYAGTCIFLAVLAVVFRAILAAKAVLEARWMDREMARRYVVVAGKPALAQRLSADDSEKRAAVMMLSENGVEENVVVVQRRDGGVLARPWRLSVDPVRALLDVVVAGVGYLLMLAVMTMNVGYFLSVLAGVFIGSLAVGRFTTTFEH
jgi:hypothetical protein